MSQPKLLILILLYLVPYFGLAQSETDSISTQTAFRKGRIITSIYGNVSSSTTSSLDDLSRTGKFVNNYNFSILFAKLLANRHGLGMHLNIARSGSEEFIQREIEHLTLGPLYRFYVSDNKHGSIFTQISLYYVGFYEHTYINSVLTPASLPTSTVGQPLNYDQTLSGNGGGALIGVGYSFTLLDRIALDIGMDYKLAYIDGVREDRILGASYKTDFLFRDYTFNFGFVVILNKMKK